MKAQQHTQSMLRWWQHVGIDRVDLAVKPRADGMIWHRDQALGSLPLAWTRAQNVHQAEVYIRPARGYDWPLVLLDDVDRPLAGRVPAKYEAMVVETSRVGGCHLWLACDRRLGEEARCEAQRWLAPQVGADLGSVSGEHLGRLAGLKNWKRGGCWVNVLDASYHGRRWDPTAAVPMVRIEKMRSPTPDARPADARCPDAPRLEAPDTSPSGREWCWVWSAPCSRRTSLRTSSMPVSSRGPVSAEDKTQNATPDEPCNAPSNTLNAGPLFDRWGRADGRG